jgi:prostaglandin-E synthase
VKLDLFKELDAEGNEYKVNPASVHMKLMKKEKEEEFWPRLLENKILEKTNVKLDWDRYVDEDEEEEGFDNAGMESAGGPGGPPGGPGGMGGMGGE